MIKCNISSYIKYLCWSFLFLIVSTYVAWAEESRCKTVEEYRKAGTDKNFILADPFEIVSSVVSKVAGYSWDSFAIPLQGVVAIGTAVYIAMYVLKNVGSFSKQDTLGFLTKEKGGVIPLCAKMAFIIALLNSQEFIYSTIITPFVTSSLSLGTAFGGGESKLSGASFDGANSVKALFDLVCEQARDLNGQIYTIVAKGQFLFCNATNTSDGGGILSWEWKLLPFALVLFVIGWFIVIGVSFNILDVLIRLGVGCIILPLAIACSISQYTSKYAKSTWQLFINCCFSFIVIGMLVLTANKIIDNILNKDIDVNIFEKTEPITKQEIHDFAASMDGSFFGLITLTIICCMIILNMFNDIETITKTISGGGSIGGMGSKVSGTATSKLQSAATKPLGLAGSAIKEGGEMLKETNAGQAVTRKISDFRTAVKKAFKVKDD